MHFTREPIIESILSAREGFKLVLKNSKTASCQEISAEVIEIVSFAGSVFYRSQDRLKNFMVPAADFEIAEVKDGRLVLKNISLEKSQKLQNPSKEVSTTTSDEEHGGDFLSDLDEDVVVAPQTSQTAPTTQNNNRLEKRRERRRNRRRRHSEDRVQDDKKEPQEGSQQEAVEESTQSESPAPIPVLNLIPPPTTLISQTLARYKEKFPEAVDSEVVVIEESTSPTSFQVPLEPEDLV